MKSYGCNNIVLSQGSSGALPMDHQMDTAQTQAERVT